ncbi:MFS transporter [Halobacteriaceae archaeon GCM10025711]
MPAEQDGRLVVGVVSASHLVNHTYIMLLPPVLTVLAAQFDVSIAQVGLAIGVQGAVVTLLQLPFGYVSDAYSRTAVLAVSLVVGAVGALLTAAAPTYEWLLVAQAVIGLGIAGHHPAHYPMIAAATAPEYRGKAFSLHGFMGVLGFATPYAVIPAASRLGFGWREAIAGIGVAGLAFAAVSLLVVTRRVSRSVRVPEATAVDDTASVRARVTDAARSLLASRTILLLAVLAFLTSAAAWGIRTYAPVLLTDEYAMAGDPANLLVAGMLAAGAVLILVGGVLADRVTATDVLLGGYAALAAVSVALASGVLPLALVPLVVLPFSGTISVSRPARSKLADAASGRGDLGKSFALVTVGISSGGAVAPPVFGAMVDLVGVSLVFYVVGAIGVAAAGVTLVIARRVDRQAAPAGVAATD